MDEQKRPEPEIMPPVPRTEPRRGSVEVPEVEIPLDKDAPEKQSPPTAEEL